MTHGNFRRRITVKNDYNFSGALTKRNQQPKGRCNIRQSKTIKKCLIIKQIVGLSSVKIVKLTLRQWVKLMSVILCIIIVILRKKWTTRI